MKELNPIALRPLIKKFQKGSDPLTNDEVRKLREYYRVASDVAKADPALEGVSAYVNLSYQQLDRYFEARKMSDDVPGIHGDACETVSSPPRKP
ncbi:hypothetical protein pEaSNUABM5_00294 [Erwinia phage pEa_SNUABM_5]|uniref:Uncharacterized protein n=1 Tax=Erwinia phage pEa_SNUABM_5 TaxID=2797313 RepID=A0A7T8IVU1_9CAUD|nr:hypothetical protein MPK73_gp294 [Erwinia phage pEa_SNUABM_5]QQO90436.1 hypothetical protein pEaSNUABM5_00294 [Erwinia phage pEa_SNUABM_5]